MRRLVDAGDHEAAGRAIPDDVLDRFAFSGTPEHVAALANAVIAAGAKRVEFGTPHGLTDAAGVDLIGRRVLPLVRRGCVVSRLAVLVGDAAATGRTARCSASCCAAGPSGPASTSPSASFRRVVTDACADAAAAADGIVSTSRSTATRRVAASPVPVVTVDVDGQPAGQPNGVARAIFGRGIDTYVWAARHLAAWLRSPGSTISYGDHRDQFGELRAPVRAGPHPVVALIHGGFWRPHWERDLMDDLAIDLVDAGWRRGTSSTGAARARGRSPSPTSPAPSITSACSPTSTAWRPTASALVGHSAGGHLALWAGGRPRHGPRGARRR